MFAWEDGKVLRLYRTQSLATPGKHADVEWQIAVLEAARSAGVRVPAIYGTVEVEGRPGIIMERLDGHDLLTTLGQKPWLIFRISRVTGRAHALLNQAPAPSSLPPVKERLRRLITTSAAVPDAYREPALKALDGLPDGDRLLHGDFHPGNIMVSGGEPVVIDWSNAARGDPEADYARARIILQAGDVPPGTQIVIRVASKFARRLLIALYVRSYEKVRRPDRERLARWELPVLVARFSEGIESEYPKLARMIEQRLRR